MRKWRFRNPQSLWESNEVFHRTGSTGRLRSGIDRGLFVGTHPHALKSLPGWTAERVAVRILEEQAAREQLAIALAVGPASRVLRAVYVTTSSKSYQGLLLLGSEIHLESLIVEIDKLL